MKWRKCVLLALGSFLVFFGLGGLYPFASDLLGRHEIHYRLFLIAFIGSMLFVTATGATLLRIFSPGRRAH